jgi:hypothetical protein
MVETAVGLRPQGAAASLAGATGGLVATCAVAVPCQSRPCSLPASRRASAPPQLEQPASCAASSSEARGHDVQASRPRPRTPGRRKQARVTPPASKCDYLGESGRADHDRHLWDAGRGGGRSGSARFGRDRGSDQSRRCRRRLSVRAFWRGAGPGRRERCRCGFGTPREQSRRDLTKASFAGRSLPNSRLGELAQRARFAPPPRASRQQRRSGFTWSRALRRKGTRRRAIGRGGPSGSRRTPRDGAPPTRIFAPP